MELLTQKYSKVIEGVLSCYDRIIIQGTIPGICYDQGMTGYLYANKIRIFDYARFAEPLRDRIRENAKSIAESNGLEIEFLQKKKNKSCRQESKIKKIIEKRGDHPGLVHIFSAMESCQTYKPWHDKKTHRTYLRNDWSRCQHYYFYFIDADLGLCYVRVPTWCPFRLQIYFNGHGLPASQLRSESIDYIQLDNAFAKINSFEHAQKISDSLSVKMLHEKLNVFAQTYCPVIDDFKSQYHWSIMQAEYATDIVFKRRQDLKLIYDQLIRTAIHTVKPENIATFLGRKFHGNYQDEMGNNFNTRIEGTRIKHTMGKNSVKMYDKFGLILRIETTVNDVSFFKHFREVEHRDGSKTKQMAPMKKSIYSLSPLRSLLFASNHRYLEFISSFDDTGIGVDKLDKVSKPVVKATRSYKGFNFFSDDDQLLFESIASGEYNISGFQNKHLRTKLKNKNSGQVSRILKRLHVHGMIKKIGHTYKYYLTKLGRKIISLGLRLKEFYLVPGLAE